MGRPIFTSKERNQNRAVWSLDAASEALRKAVRLGMEDGGDVARLEEALALAERARRALG